MTPAIAVVIGFVLFWLLIHGQFVGAGFLALLALPGVWLAARRR